MPFAFTLVMMALFSALPAAVVWAIVQKRPLPARISISVFCGTAPLAILGGLVYRVQGSGDDPDSLNFFYTAITVAIICALLAVIAMEWRLRRK